MLDANSDLCGRSCRLRFRAGTRFNLGNVAKPRWNSRHDYPPCQRKAIRRCYRGTEECPHRAASMALFFCMARRYVSVPAKSENPASENHPSKKACSDLRPGIPSVPAFAGTLLVNCWPLLLCGMFGRRQPDRRKPARRYRSVAGRGPINVRFFHRGTNRLKELNRLSAADQRRGKTSPTGGRRCPHGSSSSFIVHPPGRGT